MIKHVVKFKDAFKHWTGFSPGMWDWIIELECGTGIWVGIVYWLLTQCQHTANKVGYGTGNRCKINLQL